MPRKEQDDSESKALVIVSALDDDQRTLMAIVTLTLSRVAAATSEDSGEDPVFSLARTANLQPVIDETYEAIRKILPEGADHEATHIALGRLLISGAIWWLANISVDALDAAPACPVCGKPVYAGRKGPEGIVAHMSCFPSKRTTRTTGKKK